MGISGSILGRSCPTCIACDLRWTQFLLTWMHLVGVLVSLFVDILGCWRVSLNSRSPLSELKINTPEVVQVYLGTVHVSSYSLWSWTSSPFVFRAFLESPSFSSNFFLFSWLAVPVWPRLKYFPPLSLFPVPRKDYILETFTNHFTYLCQVWIFIIF